MRTSARLIVAHGATILCFAHTSIAFDDPFSMYLSSIPLVKQIISDTNTGTGTSAITTKRFTFNSRGSINTVFAIMAFPQAAGKYPGMLFLHGGGGNAETMAGNVVSYAQKGYAAIAIDQPGICGTTNTPYTTGPWKSRPLGEGPRFDVAAGPQTSLLVDAEVAGIEAFNYLKAQSFTDSTKMGITGSSWGGYSTTFLSGILGSKVRASWAYLGCGFYDKGSFWKRLIDTMSTATRTTWLTYLDAGRRAPNSKAPYFLEAASNDTYFWPEAVTATLDAVPGIKNHFWGPNLNHQAITSPMKQLYFDYYLKGTGSSFASATISGVSAQNDGSKKVLISTNVPSGVVVDSVKLYYSIPDTNWQGRSWIALIAQAYAGSTYSAILTPDLVTKKADFYAVVVDTRKVAVSSMMYNAASAVSVAGNQVEKISRAKPGLAPSVGYDKGVLKIRNSIASPNQSVILEVYALDGKCIAQRKLKTSLTPFSLHCGFYMIKMMVIDNDNKFTVQSFESRLIVSR
jgi:dienelactone hydrolase